MNKDIVAFIGLGNMGLPMAINIAKAGINVSAYDINPAATAKLEEISITVAHSVEQCLRNSNLVVTMLPDGSAVLNVLSEILDSLESPTTLIDCSTIDVEDARKAHKLCKEAGHSFLDAPVSGGVAGAEAGSLTAMIGGDRSVIDRCSTVLDALFDNVIFCGEAGNGQAAKLCNNMLLAVSMIGVSESFILGEKLGLSASTLFDVLSTSTGSCWSVNRYCPVADVGPKSPADNDFKPGFSAKMMLKDMNLAQKAASESDTATPLGTHAQSLYQDYVNQQGGAEDFSGISRFLRSGIRNDSQN